MNEQIVELVDPRLPSGPVIRLASRLKKLSDARIVLFDNGKVRREFGHFDEAFDRIEAKLSESAVLEVRRRRADLLRYSDVEISALAEDLASSADAVILGVADTGVSAPTVMLAAALEKLGIPTSVLCQGIGASLARAIVDRYVPGLPLPELRTWRMSSREEVALTTNEMLAEIVDPLIHAAGRKEGPETTTSHNSELPQKLKLSHDLDATFTEIMERDGYGDGLPLRAATRSRVDEMLSAMSLDPDDEIWPPVPPRSTPVRAQDVAAIAVMAGCPTQAALVVVEAFRAMAEPEFRLFQASITTHPAGTLVLVSGPIATDVGMDHRHGSMGPGNRASASIGRSVALGYRNLLGARPGLGDLSLQGSPAEFSYCVAENLADSPWPGLHMEYGGAEVSSVTVLKCEGPHNVLDNTSRDARSLLISIADTASSLGGNNLYNQSAQTVVFLNPEHANIIALDGWTKRDARMFLFEQARRRREDLVGRGIVTTWSPWVGDLVPIVEDPDDILIVVTGASGPQSQVAIPWGFSRGVTRFIPR